MTFELFKWSVAALSLIGVVLNIRVLFLGDLGSVVVAGKATMSDATTKRG